MNDYDFIKRFSDIKVTKLCKENRITKQNIFRGTASKEKMHIIKREIEKAIAKLYIED